MDLQNMRGKYASITSTMALFIALGGTGYAAGLIGPDDIADNAVRSNHILNGQVTSADVRNASGPREEPAVGGLQTEDLNDFAITQRKLAQGSVTTPKLGIGAVRTDQLGDDAVTIDKIANFAVGRDQLANLAVGERSMRPGAVRGGPGGVLLDESVTGDDLAEGSVGTDDIATGAIDGRHIQQFSIPRNRLGLVIEPVYAYEPNRRALTVRVTATCPAGSDVLGGGFSFDSDSFRTEAFVSNSQAAGNGWYVEVSNPDREAVDVGANAVCLTGRQLDTNAP